MTDTRQVLLVHHLKRLKLPTFLREYDKIARQCASEGVDHVRYLLRLAELELIDRERRMVERRIKAARFPVIKSLDSFDFKVIPSLNKTLVLELARCEYIERRENLIALGNSGTGKTHIALGLGLAACQIRALRHLRDSAKPDRAEIERELAFFRKHRQRMRYHALKAEGVAIGSGVVEAANKTLVTQRMKRSGMRWRIASGQAVLTFRALIKSARFDRAWKAIIGATDTPANDNINPCAVIAIAA